VLLAFARSHQGGSGLIIRWCTEGKIKGYIPTKVLFESRKNAAENMGEDAANALEYVFNQGFLSVIEDGKGGELERAHKAFDNKKDVPIIASAKQVPAIQFVISLDKGFFKSNVQEYLSPIEVLRPGDFINRFREELGK
jgi:hypothetical protein